MCAGHRVRAHVSIKILVSGTIGAFRLCSDNRPSPSDREHNVIVTPCSSCPALQVLNSCPALQVL